MSSTAAITKNIGKNDDVFHSTANIVLIPCDDNLPLESLKSPLNKFNLLESYGNEEAPLIQFPLVRGFCVENHNSDDTHRGNRQVVHIYAICHKVLTEDIRSERIDNFCNIRATTLAMACGRYGVRFYGDVYVGMISTTSMVESTIDNESLEFSSNVYPEDIFIACHTPDTRRAIISALPIPHNLLVPDGERGTPNSVACWILQAPSINYYEQSCLLLLQKAMRSADDLETLEESEQSKDEACRSEKILNEIDTTDSQNIEVSVDIPTFCLHCRRPANTLCNSCQGAYFCDFPKTCKYEG